MVDRFGRIDVLVNTVGTDRGGMPVHQEDLETWDLLFKANLRTTLVMCRAVVRASDKARAITGATVPI